MRRFRRRLLAGTGVAVLVAGGLFATAASSQAAGAVTATVAKASAWDGGWEGSGTVRNGTSGAISGWTVEFDLPAGTTVGTFWDAGLARSGQHYTFTNASYNGSIAAGGTASFGFEVTGNGSPTGCKVNGAACDGSGGGTDTQKPSTPAGVRVTGSTASSISLAWTAATDNVGVTGYRVYEGGTVVATSTGTSATVLGLAAGSSHTYTVTALDAAGNESAHSAAVTGTTQTGGGPGPGGSMAAAPYLYFGWGNPPDPATVMQATGIKWFTLAFMLSDGGCNPLWDGERSLTGEDQDHINAIRAAGGDVIVSFGGASGNKLGEHCADPASLAAAYEKVINAYNLKAIDIDIEDTEFNNGASQDRVLSALKLVKQDKPGVSVIVTFPVLQDGPNDVGDRLIQRAVALGTPVDTWTIMPFDFGGAGADMGQLTIQSEEGLHAALKQSYTGLSDAQIYAMQGLSSMNGITDDNETVTTANFTQMRSYASQHHLSRFTFWALNRDRPCGAGSDSDSCSGISQQPWDFTTIDAGYTG